MSDEAYEVMAFPKARRLVTDVGRVVQGKPVIRGLLEIDVTVPRRKIRALREKTGESLSFTGYLATCAGEAIDAHKMVHACRDWRGRLIVYDEVDITTMIEVERDGRRFPVGHIIRAANKKSLRQIHDELRRIQAQPTEEQNVGRLMAISAVPGFLRRLFLRIVDKIPRLTKKLKGTVVLTSVGMFGGGAGWGLALPTHTLGITVGGIAEKPGYVEGHVEPREILHVTLDFDHDIVDGAPAARFAQRFVEIVESGEAIAEL